MVTFLHWKPVPQVCQRVDAKESHGHWWKGWSTLSRKSDWTKVSCCLCRTKYNLSNCRQLDLVSTLGLFSPSFSIPVSPILRDVLHSWKLLIQTMFCAATQCEKPQNLSVHGFKMFQTHISLYGFCGEMITIECQVAIPENWSRRHVSDWMIWMGLLSLGPPGIVGGPDKIQ